MKKVKLILGLPIAILLILSIVKQFVPILKLDGYSGLILHKYFDIDTSKYSKDYSDEKFLEVEKGMTKNEVFKILGEPLDIWNPTDKIVGLQYSKSYESSNYRLRQIYLEHNIVVDVISYYYID